MLTEADIIIVGSGASGAAAAWRLSQNSSLKIVCLEQGEHTDASKYPTSSVDWELKKQTASNYNPNVRKQVADYPIDDTQSPISLANYNGFGGSTILYSGHFPRFHPSDFATRTLDDIADDWPFGYAELAPYFEQNEQMMGVAGLVGDTAYPDYHALLPPIPLGPAGEKLAKGFNKLNWHWWPSYSAINTKNHQQRAGCVNLGPCNTGCTQGAKGSVDVTYWPEALRHGVTVYTNCHVFDIPLDKQDKATGVKFLDIEGNAHFIKSHVVILAASGIGTPRILLQSKSNRFPNGLLNDYDLVGRNLMLHPLAYTEAVFDEPLNSSLGPQGCCFLSQQFYETNDAHDFKRGYTMQVLRGSPALETSLTGYLTRKIPLGKNHHKAFSKHFNCNMGIAVISEDLPELHNRIELDALNTNSLGLPGLKVHYQLHENTKKMLMHGIKRSKEVFEAAGAKVTNSFSPVKHAGWHLMGTARMGLDDKSSVVNQHGQAHAVSNLFIVDSSIFVTSGAVNPVATAQALTLKICDELSRNIKQWIA